MYAATRGARRLLVGTADVSADAIAFYGACGFPECGRPRALLRFHIRIPSSRTDASRTTWSCSNAR